MSLSQEARQLAQLLRQRHTRLVLAESCTGGLVAASLARVPGVSDYLCGSAVTYRNDTKHQWLAIPASTLAKPGPVSAVVARLMAENNLVRTPEADWSASITGHLGPRAPKGLDGVVYIGLAWRAHNGVKKPVRVSARKHQLVALTRVARQREAASLVLQTLHEAIG